MTDICNTGVPHYFDPDHHFCCKMRYWREKGAPTVTFGPGGREVFHNEPSVAARERQAIADARAGGIEPERV